MPRGRRCYPGGTPFHVLNRGNNRQTLFHTPGDYDGTGHVYQGPCKSFPVEDDDHLFTVCRYAERNAVRAGLVERAEDWVWGSTWAHLHPDDRRALPLCPWPVSRPADWLTRVNEPLTGPELEALRRCSERGRPFGSRDWVQMTADTLGLQYTLRDRGRPRKRS